MAHVTREGQIIETAMEARQAERGPSMLVVLILSMTGAIALLATLGYILLF